MSLFFSEYIAIDLLRTLSCKYHLAILLQNLPANQSKISPAQIISK